MKNLRTLYSVRKFFCSSPEVARCGAEASLDARHGLQLAVGDIVGSFWYEVLMSVAICSMSIFWGCATDTPVPQKASPSVPDTL